MDTPAQTLQKQIRSDKFDESIYDELFQRVIFQTNCYHHTMNSFTLWAIKSSHKQSDYLFIQTPGSAVNDQLMFTGK